VDAYSVIASPGSTLACPAYPIIALGGPTCLMSQRGSPASEFSLTGRRRAGAVVAGLAPADRVSLEHAATAADIAAAARPRKARREWGGRASTP
jgi:hypothetical protein